MKRDLTPQVEAEAGRDVVEPFFALFGDFPSGAVRLWSGLGEITFGGNTYEGVGEFLGLGEFEESIDGAAARGISVTLSGIPAEEFNAVMLDGYHGRTAELYVGFIDGDVGAVVTDPYLFFKGVMDTDAVDDDGETTTVKIRSENRGADLLRPREYRYTQESQHTLQGSTADKGLEFVQALQEAVIEWGQQ